jgi:dTDP-4-amino-4,6-dideoxygalactose transaminase
MPISRGSVNHRISEDLIAIGKTFLQASSCKRPQDPIRRQAEAIVSSYFGVKNTVFLPYARTCFYALLTCLRIPKGSEVLMTPFNISPMLHIVHVLGLKPAFVDINLQDFGPDYGRLIPALARKPACFLLTSLFGYVPDMKIIAELCRRYDVFLIEDISQTIGAVHSDTPLGTFGQAAIYSASMTKYVDGYNGAFILTNADDLAMSLRQFAQTLSSPSPRRLQAIAMRTALWNIALSRYGFRALTYPLLVALKVLARPVFNGLLGPSIKVNFSANLPASYFEDIANLQLQTIVAKLTVLQDLIEVRRSCALRLREAIAAENGNKPDSSSPYVNHDRTPTYWQFLVDVGNTQLAQDRLFKQGIETGITNLPDLAELCDIKLANAQRLKREFIFMPLHRHLRIADYRKMVSVLSR